MGHFQFQREALRYPPLHFEQIPRHLHDDAASSRANYVKTLSRSIDHDDRWANLQKVPRILRHVRWKIFLLNEVLMLKKELKINREEKIYIIYVYHRYVCEKIKWKSLFESFKFLKSLRIPMSICKCNFNISF